MRKSFVLYTDLWQTIQHLSDEQLGKLTRLLFEYQLTGAIPETSDPLFIAFGFIKATFDRDAEKWDKRAENARNNGLKGGRPKETNSVNTKTQKTQSVISEPTKPVSVSVSVSDSVSVNGSVSVKNDIDAGASKIKSFKKWTIEEFKQSIADNRASYPSTLLNAFYDYWTERSASGTMRFQSEKTWETPKRLKRWALNNKQPIASTIEAPKIKMANIPEQ